MILADKIVMLRKKNGWSQEELAEKLHISRQSVSKWESAQSIPDLNKILLLGQIFEVSTDYLLKDEMEKEEYIAENFNIPAYPTRKVSIEEANEFLELKFKITPYVALATALCIVSPVSLMLLGVTSELPNSHISENVAGGLGIIILLLCISVAVALFITTSMKVSHYDFLEKELIDTDYGVDGMVKERQRQYRDTYIKNNVIGTICCICSIMPMFVGLIFTEEDIVIVSLLSLMFVAVAVGVSLFIMVGIPWASFQKLLQEGDYTKEAKMKKSNIGSISTIYWLVVVAIYLAYSLPTEEWKTSWVIWPIAGVLYPAFIIISNMIQNRKSSQNRNIL